MMRIIFKSFFGLTLGLSALTTFAASSTPQYVQFYFNVHSISSSMTDADCQSIFSTPLYYDIKDGQSIYQMNTHYIMSDYQGSNVTHLDDSNYLFTGTSKMNFELNGKKYSAQENSAFLLSLAEKKIKGGFILEGYCKGNLIGFDQSVNQWPIAPK